MQQKKYLQLIAVYHYDFEIIYNSDENKCIVNILLTEVKRWMRLLLIFVLVNLFVD